MPIQDLCCGQAQQQKIQEEKAIVSAVIRYFEKGAPQRHATMGTMESSIISALHRYFEGIKQSH